MALTSADISALFRATETTSIDLASGPMTHGVPDLTWPFSSGTGNNAADLIWSDRITVTSTPTDLDFRGGLTSAFGASVAPVEIRALLIRNRSTTVGEYVSVGGDGTAPAYAGLFGAANDVIIVQPGGMLLWVAPLDGAGFQTTATTADILQIVAATGSVSVDIAILGVSA